MYLCLICITQYIVSACFARNCCLRNFLPLYSILSLSLLFCENINRALADIGHSCEVRGTGSKPFDIDMEGSALLQQALSEYLVLVQAGDNTATRSKHGGPVRDCCYVKTGTYVSVGHLLVESAVPQEQPREVRVCPGDVTDKMSLSSLIPPSLLLSVGLCLSVFLFVCFCCVCCVASITLSSCTCVYASFTFVFSY